MKDTNSQPFLCRLSHWKRLLLSVLLPLTGCSPLTSESTAIVAPVGQFSETGSAPLASHWWTSLPDAELQRLETIALEANPDLLATQARLEQAAALARKTGAQLYPQVNVGLSGNQTDGDDGYSASLAASYELDLWGGLAAATESARQSWLASREALDAAAVTLTAEVADTWYELIEQTGQIELLTQQQQTNQQMLTLIELRFDRGKVQATDVLQQRQLVESSEASLADARADKAVLEHQLVALLGQPPTMPKPVLPNGKLIDLPALPATGLPAELVQYRPDVRQAFHALRAAQADVAIAVADRFPDISLSASLTSTAGGLNGLLSDWVSVLTAELLGPVLDGGQRVAEVERSDAAARAALHDYSSAVISALTEVEDALVREQQQRLRLQSLDRQLLLTAEVVERSRYNYTKGVADYLDVLDALRTHQALQRDQLTARRTLLTYRIALHRALAGGWLADSLAPLALVTPLTTEIANL